MTTPHQDDFSKSLRERFEGATVSGQEYIDVKAGDVHKAVGGYPGTNHRMPMCCQVMRDAMRPGDSVLAEPPKGKGATLTIRYRLPR